jgi:molybdopterin molybdotransferase
MDGYAVRAADTRPASAHLRVIEDVAAGHLATLTVEQGTAIKIMTGAPLPGGADAVVKVEDTHQEAETVHIGGGVVEGENVRQAGGDLVAGAVVFRKGTRLTPHHLGVLTSIGIHRPVVRRRPVVAVLSTGDEVLAPDAELPPGKIHDSNRPQLLALLAELGAESIDLGIVGDDEQALRSTLKRGAAEAEVVLTSGGVSMGEYDMVKSVLADSGDVQFWKVAMKPAKPVAFGHFDGTPLFGLPGNPVSVVVAFEQFARPALLQMMGARALFRPRIRATLAADVHTDPEKTVFLRMMAELDGDDWTARPSGGQSSNMLTALANANAFGVVPVGIAGVAAGSRIELEMFRWPESREGGTS